MSNQVAETVTKLLERIQNEEHAPAAVDFARAIESLSRAQEFIESLTLPTVSNSQSSHSDAPSPRFSE
jgi:hypothetical protein